MPRPPTLNQDILAKIATKKRKSLPYIRQQISKRANRLNLTPEAAQLVWAKELGISIATALRSLEPQVQDQIRVALASTSISPRISTITAPIIAAPHARPADPLVTAADYLLADSELRSRCIDLLRRKKHHDRVMREATVVLENRIRTLAAITAPLKPEELINTALNPDPAKAILVFGTQAYEQQGFHSVCRGIILAFRHTVHHRLHDDVTREEALKLCSFIDILLRLLSTTRKRASPA